MGIKDNLVEKVEVMFFHQIQNGEEGQWTCRSNLCVDTMIEFKQE
jgi:hypothetical protein